MSLSASFSAGGRPKIALLSMPWYNPYAPSIQLGTLKAYVQRALPELVVDTYHYYFTLEETIGLQLAHAISDRGAIPAESLFAYALFPGKRPDIIAFLEEERASMGACLREVDFRSTIIEPLIEATRRSAERVAWEDYLLVGFSLVFAQTMSSLFMAKLIKERAPGTAVVFGGPNCTGRLGQSLLRTFPQIDFAVNGEGELPLAEIVRRKLAGGSEPLETIPGVVTRDSAPERLSQMSQLSDLAQLPVPDFRPFFDAVDASVTRPLIYRRTGLVIESSRGCWWDRSLQDPMLACSFCNLNLQWRGYREKTVEQFVEEIACLADTYKTKRFFFADNILRFRHVDDLCERIRALDKGLSFGLEARVSVKPAQLLRLRQAGAVYIQFGIEALSTRILEVINKGTTCIQNMQAMKFCERFGIANFSNVIIFHPGVEAEAIRETLTNMEFVTCYHPLSASRFVLTYESPAYKNPSQFSIRNIRNDDDLRRCVPAKHYTELFWPDKSFDSDTPGEVIELWEAVNRSLETWKARYEEQVERFSVSPLLLYEDLGSGLRIIDYRFTPPRVFELDERSRRLYLACEEATSVETLAATCPELSLDELLALLEQWVEDRIAFREGKRYLTLAIPADPTLRMDYRGSSRGGSSAEAWTLTEVESRLSVADV